MRRQWKILQPSQQAKQDFGRRCRPARLEKALTTMQSRSFCGTAARTIRAQSTHIYENAGSAQLFGALPHALLADDQRPVQNEETL